jgi:hypothetical protein
MADESLPNVHQRLATLGYVDNLIASDGQLVNAATGKIIDPSRVHAAEITRFEGTSDPDDQAIVVAVGGAGGKPIGVFTSPYGPNASADEAAVLTSMQRAVIHDAPPTPFTVAEHCAAVFTDRTDAEEAIRELRHLGLDDTHLGIALLTGQTVAFERNEEVDMARDLRWGTGAGAIAGAVGGVLLFSLAVPGLGLLGVGGLAAAGVAGGFGGSMLGAYLGIGAATEEVAEHERIRRVVLEPGEMLVVARSHGDASTVEAALQRHGGRLVTPAS